MLMSVPLDPVGNISLVLQVAILFLLILGLPFIKGIGAKKNLMYHGFLTVLALILHSILILVVMIPSFGSDFGELGGLPFLNAFNVWSHAILGTTAEILGFVIVGLWLSKPISNMACVRMRRVMLPLFVIWAVSLINGALIHIFGML